MILTGSMDGVVKVRFYFPSNLINAVVSVS